MPVLPASLERADQPEENFGNIAESIPQQQEELEPEQPLNELELFEPFWIQPIQYFPTFDFAYLMMWLNENSFM